MSTGDIICPYCSKYNGNHEEGCIYPAVRGLHKASMETSVTCLVCGNNMDYPEGYHCKNCESYDAMPLSIIKVDDDGEVTISKIGWECPICHRGLSPDVTICEHSGVSMDSVIEQIQENQLLFSGSPINFDLWKGLQWYEDEDEDED